MQLAQWILIEAKKVLEAGSPLPAIIPNSPFFVGESDDQRIISHGKISHGGKEYLIGPIKE